MITVFGSYICLRERPFKKTLWCSVWKGTRTKCTSRWFILLKTTVGIKN